LRISLEELRRRPGRHAESEAHEAVAVLSAYPDLWDVKMDSSPTDCGASRFSPEGSHEPVIDFVKHVTDKPVVGVGRFTSPDSMVSQLRRGVLDLIGAARPSIADPFLPRKIAEGREDEIRECIGCNICISSWHDGVPVRCTQNPAAGEEWRRGWHPERIEAKASDDRVLIVGGGPAGLECAQALGKRGYAVTLADAAKDWGGRLRFEASLPGLSAWRRVIDYRLGQLHRLPHVELFLESRLTAADVLEQGCERVVIATGSRWDKDLYSPLEVPSGYLQQDRVLTPSDLAEGALPEPPVLVFDFDNYYMGGAVAEHLAKSVGEVTYATPAGHASAWTIMSNELPLVHQALAKGGVKVRTLCTLSGFDGETAALADLFTGAMDRVACRSVVIVGLRRPEDRLYHDLLARRSSWSQAGLRSVTRIGDALAPGAIVHAVHSGHLYARELDGAPSPAPYRFDQPMTSLN
jgi:dimethylamine/trimethylamine dehydrogenase